AALHDHHLRFHIRERYHPEPASFPTRRSSDLSPPMCVVRCVYENEYTPVRWPTMETSARIATSMRSEPKKVYTKNLMAAYRRRSTPHTPMMKYMGMSMTSHIT